MKIEVYLSPRAAKTICEGHDYEGNKTEVERGKTGGLKYKKTEDGGKEPIMVDISKAEYIRRFVQQSIDQMMTRAHSRSNTEMDDKSFSVKVIE